MYDRLPRFTFTLVAVLVLALSSVAMVIFAADGSQIDGLGRVLIIPAYVRMLITAILAHAAGVDGDAARAFFTIAGVLVCILPFTALDLALTARRRRAPRSVVS